jgi:hypothetical protein
MRMRMRRRRRRTLIQNCTRAGLPQLREEEEEEDEDDDEEEEDFNSELYTRGARFLTRWDQHAVFQGQL